MTGGRQTNYRIPGFVLTATASAVHANAWEDNFQRWVAPETYIAASKDPEIVPSAGGAEQDLERMWRQGYVAVGYSSFNSKNSKTRDAERFAKEIGARYLIVGTALKSSRSGAIPIQSPTSTTTFTHGNAQVNGTGGYASGTFNGTSTTYGSQTTMLPFTINTFSKFAVYFAEVPRKGCGAIPSTGEQRRDARSRNPPCFGGAVGKGRFPRIHGRHLPRRHHSVGERSSCRRNCLAGGTGKEPGAAIGTAAKRQQTGDRRRYPA